MKYFFLFYDYVADYLERRVPLRDEHLELAWAAHQRGELVLGGPFADLVGGAVIFFRGETAAVAEQFAHSDPYVCGGLVRSWRVREWTLVVGRDALAPAFSDK